MKNQENPLHPPYFMVLQNWGGKLISIKQMSLKVVHFTFATIDELGQRTTRTLIGEFIRGTVTYTKP